MLTVNEAHEYRKILAQVNLSEICRIAGIKRRIVYAVLDNESSRYDDLKKVVKAAEEEIRRREEQIQSL